MHEIYADPVVGIAGLLLFLGFFIGILIWVTRSGAKEKFQKYGYIPLEENKDE